MNKREEIIKHWFRMWLEKKDSGIENLFTPDCLYIESWGPQYKGIDKVKLWFSEWNTRGTVHIWDITNFIHNDSHTAVEWYFKNKMNNGTVEEFNGVSIIEWDNNQKIKSLKEFGSRIPNYDPYSKGDNSVFENDTTSWL